MNSRKNNSKIKNKNKRNSAVKNGGILSVKKSQVNGIRFGIWLYFMLFAMCIIVAMWLYQFVFAKSYYDDLKLKDVREICDDMAQVYIDASVQSDFEDGSTLKSIAKVNGFNVYMFNDEYFQCLQGYDSNGQEDKTVSALGWTSADTKERMKALFEEVKADENSGFCKIVPDDEYSVFEIEDDDPSGDDGQTGNLTLLQSTIDQAEENRAIVYTRYFSHNQIKVLIFVYAPMYSMSTTMDTLAAQMSVVTVVALVLTFAVGALVSWQLSKPIEKMSKSAAILAKGNYDVHFEGNGYVEIDNLSDSLNYATRELAKAETVRKDIMANVSHDLRTPLTLIRSYAEMIRDLSGDNKEKRDKHLNTIISETDRLTNMVNDILKLSKTEQRMELNTEEYNISEQVTEIVEMMRVGDEKGFIIECDIQPDVFVTADKEKISQVVINFLTNAFKYSGESRFVRVTLVRLKNSVRVDVIDRGIGISQEELPYIWDRYTKASLKHQTGDSNGIGLSIVKTIISKHDGKYGVNSALGKGSDFYFELPL